MKIKRVFANNRKKCFIIEAGKLTYEFPFSELRIKPSTRSQVVSVFADQELANLAFTYCLSCGKKDSILLDQVLSYNKDTDYILELILHKLTAKALEILDSKKITKRELARKLKTSPKQLYRLLDPAFYGKSVDQMIKLLHALGLTVELNFQKIAA